ncbi:MAG: phospholipid scramblase-related protein [Aeromicrobium sp.]
MKIQKQVQRAGIANMAGAPDLAIHSEPILVVNQKGKLLELRAEYAIFDRNGLQLAAVQGKRMSSRIQVVDMAGRSLLDLRREATLISSKTIVTGEDGAKIGRIVPSRNLNQVDRHFKLEDDDNKMIGSVYAEDRRRHRDFNVQDRSGSVVARITKTRAGLATELLTKGDNYVMEFPGHLTGPLRMLSIATALVVDRSFHQR